MSYPGNLSSSERKIWSRAMSAPILKKGDILNVGDFKVELLEDSVAHGCPRVKRLDTGEESYMTMYAHLSLVSSWKTAKMARKTKEVKK